MVSPNNVSDYYSVGDIFVSASTSETQGLTYMEAMASGLPLLCRYDECLDGVIENGVNGYSYRSREDFIDILCTLASDDSKRTIIGKAAQMTMKEKYSVSAFADSCEKLYRRYAY